MRPAKAFVRPTTLVLGLLLGAGMLAVAIPGRAALARPAYDTGDQWVYVLRSSLAGLPGFNATPGGGFQLGLTGIVEVDVVGVSASGIRAETHASGFLNGTFPINGTPLRASGTFSADTVDLWEGQDYLPVASNGSSVYTVDVHFGIPVPVSTNLWVNSTTAYGSLPSFELKVGDSASAPFTTMLDVATSFSAFGFGQRAENRTSVAGAWARHVLGVENVTVGAGTFAAYRLNESLGGFPGLMVMSSAQANETAWWSNQVGNHVRREAYVNGTKVAEMTLKSYTYPAAPQGLSVTDTAVLVAAPLAAAAVIVFLLVRRRRARPEKAKASSGVEPVGELPPKDPGGPR